MRYDDIGVAQQILADVELRSRGEVARLLGQAGRLLDDVLDELSALELRAISSLNSSGMVVIGD